MKTLMATIDDAEIVALARHFSAQAAVPAAGPRQPDKARAGAELSRQALCGTCHLAGYVGQNQVPRLAGQQEAYLLATLKMYRDKPAPGRWKPRSWWSEEISIVGSLESRVLSQES